MAISRQLFWLVDLPSDVYVSILSLVDSCDLNFFLSFGFTPLIPFDFLGTIRLKCGYMYNITTPNTD